MKPLRLLLAVCSVFTLSVAPTEGAVLLGPVIENTSTSPVLLGLVLENTSTSPVRVLAIPQGTPSFKLDLIMSTGGSRASTVQFAISTSATPASLITYGPTTPVENLNNPFEGLRGPANGAPVVNNFSTGATALFNPSSTPGASYAAFENNAVARYQFNVASLPAGQYSFTPIGQEFSNGVSDFESEAFGRPSSFTLTVVPEPGTALMLLASAAGMVGLVRRRGSQ